MPLIANSLAGVIPPPNLWELDFGYPAQIVHPATKVTETTRSKKDAGAEVGCSSDPSLL
ncbi:hypothetical protein IMZ48_03595 [Candidatus Bathyarchaeota archaeon]|nr:hypothetical protein [Candidatus Bathyarchaeota archaeon]